MAFKRTTRKNDYVSSLWVKQVGQALAKKFKVSVRKGKNWSADVTKGVLTYGPEIHMLNHQQALGILCHEIGHLRYTKHPTETDVNKKYPELSHQSVNMLEDHRIEHLMSKDFPGAKEAIALMRQHMNAKCADSLKDTGRKLKNSFDRANDRLLDRGYTPFNSLAELQQHQITDAPDGASDEVELRHMLARQSDEARVPVATQILLTASLMHFGEFSTEDYPDPEVNHKARKLADLMAQHDIENMKSTQDISDFFHDHAYPVLGQYFTVQEERKAKQSNVTAGTEDSEDRKNRYDARTKSDEMRERVEDLVEQATGERPSLGKGGGRDKYREFDYQVTVATIQAEVGTAVKKLKRILRDKMFDRYSGRFLSGQLNQRKLYKHRLGDMRLFKRKVVDDKRDFAFMLSVDVSGSMQSHNRMTNAQKAMVLLLEVLDEVGVPVGISKFGNYVTTVKRPEEPVNRAHIEKEFTKLEGHTQIVDGTYKSAQLLMTTPETNRVHITITDGQVWHSDRERLVELQRKFSGIKFYGIGLGTDLEGIFPDDHRFNLKHVEDLMPTLLSILQAHIKN